jgi:hypothetical protein
LNSPGGRLPTMAVAVPRRSRSKAASLSFRFYGWRFKLEMETVET